MGTSRREGDERIAIIAGGGVLPGEVAAEIRKSGGDPVIVGIDGEIDAALAGQAAAVLTFGQFGNLFHLLEQAGVRRIVFAGWVRKRPEFSRLRLDMTTLMDLPKLVRIVMGGDNSVLSKAARYFSQKGFEVTGVHEVAPGLLAASGLIAGHGPTRQARINMEVAIRAARHIGEIDAGQAAIAERGRAVALEGVEGTDAMLERVALLREQGRLGSGRPSGVLAKAAKPGQDLRADLPAIGPQTITAASKAGLAGIAVHAGHSLILQRRETLEAVRSAGLFLHGFTLDETAGGNAS